MEAAQSYPVMLEMRGVEFKLVKVFESHLGWFDFVPNINGFGILWMISFDNIFSVDFWVLYTYFIFYKIFMTNFFLNYLANRRVYTIYVMYTYDSNQISFFISGTLESQNLTISFAFGIKKDIFESIYIMCMARLVQYSFNNS